MAPKKATPKRPADSGGESGTATPNRVPEDDEAMDEMTRFLNGISLEQRENVKAIIDQSYLDIETKLTYLEDYLTVGQVKTCKKLLEEKDSNFRQFCPSSQIVLINRMIAKNDYSSVKAIVSGLKNPEAMTAFENYLTFNGISLSEPTKDENPKAGRGKKPKPPPKKESSDDESNEEEDEEEDEFQEEEEVPEPPRPKKGGKGKNNKKPEPSSYDEWQKQKNEPGFKDADLSPTQIWEMSKKATEECKTLEQKILELQTANGEMKKKIQDLEEMHKVEKEGLNTMHEQKMQEASRKHLDDMKLKEREIAALRQTQGPPPAAE